jgi:hypothetical protein
MSQQVYNGHVKVSVLLRIKITFLFQLRNTVRPLGRAVFLTPKSPKISNIVSAYKSIMVLLNDDFPYNTSSKFEFISHHPPPKPGWSEADLAFFIYTFISPNFDPTALLYRNSFYFEVFEIGV